MISSNEAHRDEKHEASFFSFLQKLCSVLFSPFWSLYQALKPQQGQQKHGNSYNLYLAFLLLGFAIFLLVIGSLYIWILSRQVRPRQINKAVEHSDRPPSPTSKRIRNMRSYSFSDLHEFAQEKQQEPATFNQLKDDYIDFPLSLQLKFGSVQLNWTYEALSRVFSFLREDFLPIVTKYALVILNVRLHHYNKGDRIFGLGDHDGSILIVSRGQVALAIHNESKDHIDAAHAGEEMDLFTKTIEAGEVITSSLALLAMLVDQLEPPTRAISTLKNKVCNNLSAHATADEETTILQIPWQSVCDVTENFSDCFYRVAQVVLDQMERITIRSLIDHFGIYSSLYVAVPLIQLQGFDPADFQDDKHIIKAILSAFADTIRLQDVQTDRLSIDSKVLTIQSGDTIDLDTVKDGMYIVISGSVKVQTLVGKHIHTLYIASPGCEIGLAFSVIGYHTIPLCLSCEDTSVLLWIPASAISELLENRAFATHCVRHLLEQYSDLVCTVDSSFEWLHLQGGELLFERGDHGDAVYTVLSGRLRAIQGQQHCDRTIDATSELSRGTTLGALDMLTGARCTSTVHAIRDSQISKMPKNVFDYIVSVEPTVLIHFTKSLVQKFPGQSGIDTSTGVPKVGLSIDPQSQTSMLSRPSLSLGTIAVIALTKKCHLSTFCDNLLESLQENASKVSVVSSEKARKALGTEWISRSRMARANMSTWLGDMENSNELVVYKADSELTFWTKLCVRQADHILLLCSDADTHRNFLEDVVEILQSAWRRKNVAISVVRIREKNWTVRAIETSALKSQGKGASAALKRRLRILRGESLILPKLMLPMEKYEWVSYFHNVQEPFEEHKSDFNRLARRVTGNALGLVLGGGGARGLAHIGVLRALEECDICVDVVGGTSFGALIGAIYSLHPFDLKSVEAKIKLMSASLSSVMEKLRDLTLPIASFFNGNRFNQAIQEHFRDLHIEDLVLNYFCVTTDIAKSRMSIHRCGYVWKYVRASMSLQGYLPPVSEEGSLLLDGGYMNNLPADVMHEEGGVKYILAVDVGSEPRHNYHAYGASLSGWWILWNKLNPFTKTAMVPSMGDVSAALAFVASSQNKERIRNDCINLYLRPPVQDYGTLQFDKMEEIIRLGYEYALPRIREWQARVLAQKRQNQFDVAKSLAPLPSKLDETLATPTRSKSISAELWKIRI
uniref:Patatin like protein putative n=1 Tax=Albugo laibachii Nc14 TaxID=890382 RepID=F0W1U8_9STRA|nr:Patatin like protein putative [Albugo laibachii Nc14]CCA23168.1 Patatin like protein putative [Albugo laibachii Nc14]|eukprot:CCA23168.1 Patatin like protein putative [Albugo laibachii Nc14]